MLQAASAAENVPKNTLNAINIIWWQQQSDAANREMDFILRIWVEAAVQANVCWNVFEKNTMNLYQARLLFCEQPFLSFCEGPGSLKNIVPTGINTAYFKKTQCHSGW